MPDCPVIDCFRDEYEFLSNFYPSAVLLEGVMYPSVEAAYQAAKTLDLNIRERFRTESNASLCKKMGRALKIRDDWESVKIKIMTDIVRIKFSVEPFRRLLLDTHPATLIEGNHWNDTFWGVCKGKGQNNLGKILMRIRQELLWQQ